MAFYGYALSCVRNEISQNRKQLLKIEYATDWKDIATVMESCEIYTVEKSDILDEENGDILHGCCWLKYSRDKAFDHFAAVGKMIKSSLGLNIFECINSLLESFLKHQNDQSTYPPKKVEVWQK